MWCHLRKCWQYILNSYCICAILATGKHQNTFYRCQIHQFQSCSEVERKLWKRVLFFLFHFFKSSFYSLIYSNKVAKICSFSLLHYCDVIMGAVASQITSLMIVYSTVYSDADQSKHQSSASLAFVRGIHRGPVNSPHKWPVTRKMFPFDDVIMITCWMCVHVKLLHIKQSCAASFPWQLRSLNVPSLCETLFFLRLLYGIPMWRNKLSDIICCFHWFKRFCDYWDRDCFHALHTCGKSPVARHLSRTAECHAFSVAPPVFWRLEDISQILFHNGALFGWVLRLLWYQLCRDSCILRSPE